MVGSRAGHPVRVRRLFARDRDRPAIEGYEDLQLIGSGGFSRVYRAMQPAFDRPVAIKVITASVGTGDIGRFADELRITGRLEGHPNVIRVYESGRTSDGRPFLSMELFEQGSYGTWLRRHGPLRVAEVLSSGVKLAGALQAAHDRSVIHRDVKPQNVLRSPFVGPVLTDFGIAGLLERRGAVRAGSDSEAFSVLHAAPEVLAGEPASSSSDLYSLGSSLYELLTGRPPFHDPGAPGVLDVLARVDAGAVAPITRPDLPEAAARTLVGLLARNPADRPASGIELASRLQSLEVDLGLSPTEIPGYEGAGAGRFQYRPVAGTPGPAEPPQEGTPPDRPGDLPVADLDAATAEPGTDTVVPGDHTIDPGSRPPMPAAPPPATPPAPRAGKRGRRPSTHTVQRRPPGPAQRAADDDPEPPRRWPKRLAIAAGGVVVLVAGGFGVQALTVDDEEAAPTTTVPTTTVASTTTTATTTTATTIAQPAPPACPDLVAEPVPEPAGPQPAPTGISVEPVGDGLSVTWTDQTGGAAGHVVFLRCVAGGGTVTRSVAAVPRGVTNLELSVADRVGARWCVSVGSVQPGGGTRLPESGEQFVCTSG